MPGLKILLVQLGANGDCLFVTTVAKQIKAVDYPGCSLTWMIGSKFVQVLANNPDVDEIIEIPINQVATEIKNLRDSIPDLILTKSPNNYDKIFITDYTPANYSNWFGTIRSSLFRSYPHKLTVSPDPVILLTNDEVKNVQMFCQQKGILPGGYNILFECSPQSGQSEMNFDIALQVAERLVTIHENVRVILTSPNAFNSPDDRIIDGSKLSWRENAEMINCCQLLVGCSSGISWLCTSDWCNPVKKIQIINPDYMQRAFSASMQTDFRYFGKSVDDMIELHNPDGSFLFEVIERVVNNGFKSARKTYNVKLNYSFRDYRFLKESNLGAPEKMYYLLKYHLVQSTIKIYQNSKPSWFQPGVWVKKIRGY